MKFLKRFSAVVCGAICLAAFSSCKSTTAPKVSLHISGVVTNFAGAPIVGAKVFLETVEIPFLLLGSAPLDSALTDAQGRYAVSYVNDEVTCISIYQLHVTNGAGHDVYTNDLSGNSIKCTSAVQTINFQM